LMVCIDRGGTIPSRTCQVMHGFGSDIGKACGFAVAGRMSIFSRPSSCNPMVWLSESEPKRYREAARLNLSAAPSFRGCLVKCVAGFLISR
jgi:hypothetical protein